MRRSAWMSTNHEVQDAPGLLAFASPSKQLYVPTKIRPKALLQKDEGGGGREERWDMDESRYHADDEDDKDNDFY